MTAPTATANLLDQLVERAGSLFSLPAVAVEVLELTAQPRIDTRALKACVERDPALTGRLLRVVNSSLFGLSREVTDLNQALALLGVKPLKLLVLGFSLPKTLLCRDRCRGTGTLLAVHVVEGGGCPRVVAEVLERRR